MVYTVFVTETQISTGPSDATLDSRATKLPRSHYGGTTFVVEPAFVNAICQVC